MLVLTTRCGVGSNPRMDRLRFDLMRVENKEADDVVLVRWDVTRCSNGPTRSRQKKSYDEATGMEVKQTTATLIIR